MIITSSHRYLTSSTYSKCRSSTTSRQKIVCVCDARDRFKRIREFTKNASQTRTTNGNKLLESIKDVLKSEYDLRQQFRAELVTFIQDEMKAFEKIVKDKVPESSNFKPIEQVVPEVVAEIQEKDSDIKKESDLI